MTPVSVTGATASNGIQFTDLTYLGGIQRSGKIWQFVQGSSGLIGAYLFDPIPQTFSLIDGTNSINSSSNAAAYWDGAASVTFCYFTNPASLLVLRTFDLDTQTWGADFSTGNQPALSGGLAVAALRQRSDGTWIAITPLVNYLPNYSFEAYIVSDGTNWGTPEPYDVSVPGYPSPVLPISFVLDPSDILHVIFWWFDGANFHIYEQQILADNSLGVFTTIIGNIDGLTFSVNDGFVVGALAPLGILFAGDALDGGGATYPTVYYGTPVATPTYSQSATIDPSAVPVPPLELPSLYLVNGVLYAIWMNTSYQIFIAQTSAPGFLTGWTSALFYDPNGVPPLFPPGDSVSGFTPTMLFDGTGTLLGVFADYSDTTTGFGAEYYFSVSSSLVAVPDVLGLSLAAATAAIVAAGLALGAVTGIGLVVGQSPAAGTMVALGSTVGLSLALPAAQLGGSTGARFKPCLNRGHEWMEAQLAEKLRQERERRSAWPYHDLFPVAQDLEVNRIAVIVAPNQDGNLHVVLQYQVPSGFRFRMAAILQDGPTGISPGDASWVVDINAEISTSTQASRIQGLINLPVPLGSTADGRIWPFVMPYIFDPLTVIRSKVMNVHIVPGSPNFFTSGFFGFLEPLGRGQR